MRIAVLLSTAALFALPAFAQMQSGTMSSMGKSAHNMAANPSMHTMPASVTSVDAKTGIVEVNSAGMALKLHFPPASVADLKSGDKITLHLGFTKP